MVEMCREEAQRKPTMGCMCVCLCVCRGMEVHGVRGLPEGRAEASLEGEGL